MSAPARPQHTFSVDVEDYFHSEDPDVSAWDRHESRVEHSTHTILELCGAARVRGTFFVLGWVATRMPGLVHAIAAAGHEVASHGHDHQFVYRQTPAQFREDVHAARTLLEDIVSTPVRGYRAPYFSITASTPWAHEVLAEVGYQYSSSVFPGSNPRYGIPGHSQDPTWVTTRAGARIREFPISTLGARIGCGGVYFRALPYVLFSSWIAGLEREGRAATFYIHPWEADPGKPAAHGSLGLRLRHGVGIRSTAPRLRRLFADFAFGTIGSRLAPVDSPVAV